MTQQSTHNLLRIAQGGVALMPADEHELEDLGMIEDEGGPFATVTEDGIAALVRAGFADFADGGGFFITKSGRIALAERS